MAFEIEHENGTIESTHQNGDRVWHFPNGSIKQAYKKGEEVTWYYNGDIQQRQRNGDTIYYYARDGSIVITFASGILLRKWTNGQRELLYPNGLRKVEYSNGAVRVTDPEGIVQTTWPRVGLVERRTPDGSVEVNSIDYGDKGYLQKTPDTSYCRTESLSLPQFPLNKFGSFIGVTSQLEGPRIVHDSPVQNIPDPNLSILRGPSQQGSKALARHTDRIVDVDIK